MQTRDHQGVFGVLKKRGGIKVESKSIKFTRADTKKRIQFRGVGRRWMDFELGKDSIAKRGVI